MCKIIWKLEWDYSKIIVYTTTYIIEIIECITNRIYVLFIGIDTQKSL
jgi:hypothetical protein